MKTAAYQPLFHRFAVLTACAVLLPIVVGALVTTMRWGMAFLDWPTSDGHNMFFYPWLASAADADKFTEHGHRLAGALIGVLSIALAALAWMKESRTWVKLLATLLLLGVIAQGLLGGQRVLLNRQALAMVHGSVAAVVFTMMAALALFTSRRWFEVERPPHNHEARRLKPLAVVTPLVIFGQYMLGGLLRHLGTALYEHIALAFVALLFILATVVGAHRSRIAWLRRAAYLMGLVAVLQIGLGVGSFVTKYGLQSVGYVAVQHSLPQVLLRTSHTVVGMVLLMTAVIYALRVFRVDAVAQANAPHRETSATLAGAVAAKGGA